MTAKSMTGYGKLITSNDLCDLKIEMKAVNSRYFDCNLRMPKLFNFIEIDLKSAVKDILVRGKVDIYVDLKLKKNNSTNQFSKRMPLRATWRCLKS